MKVVYHWSRRTWTVATPPPLPVPFRHTYSRTQISSTSRTDWDLGTGLVFCILHYLSDRAWVRTRAKNGKNQGRDWEKGSSRLALVLVSAPEDISPGSPGGRFSLHKKNSKFNSILNWGPTWKQRMEVSRSADFHRNSHYFIYFVTYIWLSLFSLSILYCLKNNIVNNLMTKDLSLNFVLQPPPWTELRGRGYDSMGYSKFKLFST